MTAQTKPCPLCDRQPREVEHVLRIGCGEGHPFVFAEGPSHALRVERWNHHPARLAAERATKLERERCAGVCEALAAEYVGGDRDRLLCAARRIRESEGT